MHTDPNMRTGMPITSNGNLHVSVPTYTFVFAVDVDFNNVVVVWMLRFKVDTGKFGRDVKMGNIQLNKAFVAFKIVILSVVLLPFAIEEFKRLHLVFLLVVSSPIFNNFDDPVRHWEGGDHMVFLTTPVLMLKTLCVPWQLPV